MRPCKDNVHINHIIDICTVHCIIPSKSYYRREKAKSDTTKETESEYGAKPYMAASLSGTVRSMKSLASTSPSAYSSEDGNEDVLF